MRQLENRFLWNILFNTDEWVKVIVFALKFQYPPAHLSKIIAARYKDVCLT